MATTPSGAAPTRRAIRFAPLLVACFMLAGIVHPGPTDAAGVVAHLELTAAEQVLVPWGYVDLGYRITTVSSGVRGDLYVAMVTASVDQCVAPDMVFASASIPALATDVAVQDGRGSITTGSLPDQLGAQVLTLYGVLVKRGASAGDAANWLSNLATLDLQMSALSASQMEVIAARGNPRTYLVQFFRDTRQRLDTWIYEGGGAGQVFQFVNGRPLTNEQDNSRARAQIVGAPTAFGPGRFVPGTTPAEVRALLGDPDKVVHASTDTDVWVFDGSRMSVTVKHGVVRQVSAY